MVLTPTELTGVFLVDIEAVEDERGFFARSWCSREFQAHGVNPRLMQCSVSRNRAKGTLRGLHYQVAPHEEAKLVRCTMGAIYDVIVDVRPDSYTHLRHVATVLSAENHRAIYVPEGCAHGFLTLADESEVFYQISDPHVPGVGRGLRWNDPLLRIPWPEPVRMISERDRTFPDFQPTAAEEIRR